MARIRSVHPELFTDEGFCALSPLARLLFIGIWTQCDDQGVFEWKPFAMKITLAPVDTVDMASLLGELVENKQVLKYEAGGRTYGAVRNFCRFQRPKKLVDRHPILPHIATYVSLEVRKSPQGDPKGTPKGEKLALRRGEEGRVEGEDQLKTNIETLEGESAAEKQAPPAADPHPKAPVQVLKEARPTPRPGLRALGAPLPDTWTPDEELCEEVSRDYGLSEDEIRAQLLTFHAHHATAGSFSANWRASFKTWCAREKAHKDKQAPARVEVSKSAPSSPLPRDPHQWPPEQWEKLAAFWAKVKHWPADAGPDPMSPACLCPRYILAKHDPMAPALAQRRTGV